MVKRIWPEQLAPIYDVLSRLYRLWGQPKYPLHRDEKDIAPFLIIGSGRCGSTLLRRMLDAHAAIHIPPETYVLGEVCRLYMRNRQMDWKYLVNTVYAVFEFCPEFDKFDMHLSPLVHRMWALPESERSLARLLDAFYRYHAQTHKLECTLWGDKTPQNTFELDVLHQTMPHARYIHLLRDGMDVAASFVERGLIADLSTAGKHWQKSVLLSRAFMQAHPQQCVEVRYEDLVAQPEQHMQRLCAFLGIGFDREMSARRSHTQAMGDLDAYAHYSKVLEPVSKNYIGLGRQTLSAAQRQLLVQEIGDTLHTMGYQA